MGWGNAIMRKVHKDAAGAVTAIDAGAPRSWGVVSVLQGGGVRRGSWPFPGKLAATAQIFFVVATSDTFLFHWVQS